jgi:integrase/recombinase XerD
MDMNNWEACLAKFKNFLRVEKGLSENSWQSYISDLQKLQGYFEPIGVIPEKLSTQDLSLFLKEYNELGFSARSQARLLSSIKNLFTFMEYEEWITENPATIIPSPKIPKNLPDTLDLSEIDSMIAAFSPDAKLGLRNRAILEVLYGCGLRVSECVDLKISQILFDDNLIRVKGKGQKERFVPLAPLTTDAIRAYINMDRNTMEIQPGFEDILFLNRRGKQLTRVMLFYVVRKAAELAGLQKVISPHTLRHSFATHMVQNGADLRSVQEMLGHANLVTTEIYTHLDTQFLKEVVESYHPFGKKHLGK